MGTTAQKLNKVLQTKNAIKEAIIEKGVKVSSSDTFASYPEKILEIKTGGNIYDGPFEIVPTSVDPTIQDPAQWDVFEAPFIKDKEEFEGLSLVKVRKVGAWIDSNISADNIRQGHTILGVRGNVVELLPEERTVTSSQSTQVITPSTGRNGITKITINPYVLQAKTVNPTFTTKTYYPESGYNGFSQFSVNAIDVQIIVDEEPKLVPENIKKNVSLFGGQIVGTYDNYVAPVVDILNVTPTTSAQTIHVPQGIDGYNIVNVEAVTSAIDPNIIAKNIKRDVEILGVIGTYTVENLQDKVVDPQPYIQNITFDSTLGYEGLRTVTVNPVTSSVDANIKASNIKKDVQILNVIGTYEGEPISFQEKTVEPTTLSQVVTPDAGYDGLSKVNIGAVTASIDPNILAENIKKNISILGVTGTYEDLPNYQESKTVQPVTSGDIEVTPDPTYDALLKVIVKAVTASIDPNIMPKNIRKNISILGVLGTMEEGGEQKWFDFSGIQNFVELNQDAFGEGGNESIKITASDNNYQLAQMINGTFPGIGNINAVMFTQVYGYDNLSSTDNGLEQLFIFFTGGQLYTDYSKLTRIKDQIRWLYPYTNDYGVDGCLINYTDDGTEKVLKLYVLTDSTNANQPVPVLVDGTMSASLLPEGFDGFRYVVDMTIPAHTVFDPKITLNQKLNWVLQARKGVKSLIHVNENKPLTIDVSAYDKNFGEEDPGTSIPGSVVDFNVSPLSSNGTLGGGSFAVSANDDGSHYAYYAFDQNSDTYWRYGASSGSFTFYNPEAIIVNQILYSPYYSYPTAGEIRGSNNGSDWTTITSFTNDVNSTFTIDLSSNNTAYKYYQIYISSVNRDVIHCSEIQIKVKGKDINATSHTIYPLTKDLLFYERSNELGNLVNYVDNGDAVDIKLYHTSTEGSMPADLSYPFEFDSTIDTSKLIDGSNFIINKNLNAITNGPKSWHVNNGSSYGYFKIHTPNESTTFSVTAYVSSEGKYDFGGCYVGTQIYNAGRDAITSSATDGHGKWVFMNSNSSESTYTTTLEANTEYYIQFYYTKDGSGDSGEDRVIIKNMKFSYYGKSDLYIFAPDENLGSEYKNVEYIDTISIPEHNIYINDDNQWYPAKHITIDVDNADTTIYTEIEDKE